MQKPHTPPPHPKAPPPKPTRPAAPPPLPEGGPKRPTVPPHPAPTAPVKKAAPSNTQPASRKKSDYTPAVVSIIASILVIGAIAVTILSSEPSKTGVDANSATAPERTPTQPVASDTSKASPARTINFEIFRPEVTESQNYSYLRSNRVEVGDFIFFCPPNPLKEDFVRQKGIREEILYRFAFEGTEPADKAGEMIIAASPNYLSRVMEITHKQGLQFNLLRCSIVYRNDIKDRTQKFILRSYNNGSVVHSLQLPITNPGIVSVIEPNFARVDKVALDCNIEISGSLPGIVDLTVEILRP